jgi:hypothetical protein
MELGDDTSIVWADDGNDTMSLAEDGNGEHLIVVGSRFDGMNISDMPMWLKTLAMNQSIVSINGTLHFYTGDEGGWYPLRSVVTMKCLGKELGLYAPVNFATAVEPYITLVEAMPWPTVIMTNTFTQGRLRYRYQIDVKTGIVVFSPNQIGDGEPNAKNTLCSIPVSNVNPILRFNIMYKTVRARRTGGVGWIYRVFGESMITVLWAIGDMLYDSTNKRLFILYGPGGVGKSTVVNIIGAIIGGTIPTLGSQFITVNPKSYSRCVLHKSQVTAAASSRLINIPDVDVRKGDELNMQSIKSITGGDEVDGMKVSTTLLMTVNNLFRHDDQKEYTKPDRVRRVVVIPTVSRRCGSDSESIPVHQSSIDELVQFAIRARIKHRRPPLQPDALLATLFQDNYKEALELVYIDHDAALWECMTATSLLCWRFGVDLSVMSHCLEVVGCSCCVVCGHSYFIAHIKPLHGHPIHHLFAQSTSTRHIGRARPSYRAFQL